MTPRALITGITGQDGSYLAELLLEKGYHVVGMVRRASTENFERIAHLRDRIELRQADLLDQLSLIDVLKTVRPTEIYNLAAMSFVPTSWQQPVLTAEFDAIGRHPHARGDAPGRARRRASTRRARARCSARCARRRSARPRRSIRAARTASPRSTGTTSRSTTARATACSPARASCSTTRARGAGASSSPARSPRAWRASRWVRRRSSRIGNLDARRDWGFAGDYVDAMWRMLQQPAADDYVVATGEAHSVRELVEIAFAVVGLDWQRHVRQDPALLRPAEVEHADRRRGEGAARCSAGRRGSASPSSSR